METPQFSLQDDDGAAILVAPSGLRRPLVRDGRGFEALRQGWSPEAFHQALAPITIIALRHLDGGRACWIVDASNETYCEPVHRLPDAMRRSLHLATRRALDTARGEWDRMPRRVRLELLANTQADAAVAADGLIDQLAHPEQAPGARLRVRCQEEQLSIILPGGWEIPILLGGRVLLPSDFESGWTAETLYRDFAPSYLLELRHSSGAQAAWLLDRQLRQVGDIWRPPPGMGEVLVRHAAPVMDRYLASVLAFQEPAADPVVERYLALDPSVRHALIAHSGGSIRPPLEPFAAGRMPQTFALPTQSGAAVTLAREAVGRAVTTDLHQRTLEAILCGRFEWPSPVDASPARLCGIFTFDDYVFVYQFLDRNGLDFMLVAGDRSARVIGLVLPSANLFVFDEQVPRWMHDDWLRFERGGDFWFLLHRHVNQYATEIARRARGETAAPVNVLLSNVHIGHHLWNDLTGLEALCDAVPAARLPMTMILGADDLHAELFGPIDALFPHLAGHVDRSLPDVDAFIRWTYENDVWPCRITRERITAALRERVTRALDATADAQMVRDSLGHPALSRSGGAPAAPVIIFGLRVEDRTFTDLEEFCAAFVGFIADRHPGATIVFDGHNRGPTGAVIRGMAYALAQQAPEEVEFQIVRNLSERFALAPVSIVGTTGQSIATSLAWCRHADAAFAIWGAGLAKYRWLANLPTMMISTRDNLLHRPDLPIYHDPRFVEAPAPALLVDPDWITDTGQEGALASGHIQGHRGCFSADPEVVLPAFDAFLRQIRADAH